MWNVITEFLGFESEKSAAGQSRSAKGHKHELHMVSAALMAHVALSHDDFSTDERAAIIKQLSAQFDISHDESTTILDHAINQENDAIDLHQFTRVIVRELDQEGRQEIIRLLWQAAFADNHLDTLEDNTIFKISELLGVGTRDRVRLKQEVRAQAEQSKQQK